MTRRAMVKKITAYLGTDRLDGTKHIDRPTVWLQKMITKISLDIK